MPAWPPFPALAAASRLLCLAMLSLATLVPASLPGHAAEPDEAAYRAITSRVVGEFAAQAAQGLRDSARQLIKETPTTCDHATAPSDTLRATFRDVAMAWGRLSVARFGPVIDDNRIDRLAFWPDPRGVIHRQTAQMTAALAGIPDVATWIATQSAAVQGLPAFDLLAFGETDARNCRSARAVAENIARLADAIADGFATPDKLAMMTPAPSLPVYHGYRDSVAEVFRALSTQIELLRVTMIAAPLGSSTADVKPGRLFVRYAPATKAYLLGAVNGLQGMLDAMRLETVLAEDRRALPARARSELQTARQAIEQLPLDVAAHLSEEETWNRLEAVDLALQRFGRIINGGMAPALGFKQGFNALDGD